VPNIWCIYHIKFCKHSKPAPKNKLTVIVCKDTKCMGFLINSEIHPFIQNRPNLLVCQVKIETKDYKCLKHTSYIDCLDIYDFSDKELVDERDSINIVTKAKIKKAVKISPRIEIRYQKMILRKD
jgi:hypothetical protein